LENFRYIQLNVLRSFRAMYPDLVLGLSDHTPGHATVLGAIALGARVVEKHFTDDNERNGPDHRFSMDPRHWREMVNRSRELEAALGTGVKQVEQNERETVVLQRRAIRLSHNIPAGHVLTQDDLIVLRPCPVDGLPPYRLSEVVGRPVRSALQSGMHLRWRDLE
jgi:N-acetylneuraminate synthase